MRTRTGWWARTVAATLTAVLALVALAARADAHTAVATCVSAIADNFGDATVTYYGPGDVVIETYVIPSGTANVHRAPAGVIGVLITWADGFRIPALDPYNPLTCPAQPDTPTEATTTTAATTTTVDDTPDDAERSTTTTVVPQIDRGAPTTTLPPALGTATSIAKPCPNGETPVEYRWSPRPEDVAWECPAPTGAPPATTGASSVTALPSTGAGGLGTTLIAAALLTAGVLLAAAGRRPRRAS